MNRIQKQWLVLGIAVMVAMLIYPPWTKTTHEVVLGINRSLMQTETQQFAGYAPLFEPPPARSLPNRPIARPGDSYETVSIAFDRFILQWLTVAFLAGAGLLYFKSSDKSSLADWCFSIGRSAEPVPPSSPPKPEPASQPATGRNQAPPIISRANTTLHNFPNRLSSWQRAKKPAGTAFDWAAFVGIATCLRGGPHGPAAQTGFTPLGQLFFTVFFGLCLGLFCAAATYLVAGLYFAAKGGTAVLLAPDDTAKRRNRRALLWIAFVGVFIVLYVIGKRTPARTTQGPSDTGASLQTEQANIPAEVDAQAAAQFQMEFFQNYPDLESHRAVVDEVASRLQAAGFRAETREDVMAEFAKRAREEIAGQKTATPTRMDQPNAATLAQRYENGSGVPQDYVEAYKWYCFAAVQGDNDAVASQARIYPRSAVAFENDFYARYPTLKPYEALVAWAASQRAARALPDTQQGLVEAFAKAATEEVNRLSARVNGIVVETENRINAPQQEVHSSFGNLLGFDKDVNALRRRPEYQEARRRDILQTGRTEIELALQAEMAKYLPAGNRPILGQVALAALKTGAERAASLQLGLLYENGDGVAKDYAKAASWYRMAAGHGDALAQNNLAGLYERGLGVPKDCDVAYKWYLEAAKNGNLAAQHNLGLLFHDGRGVQQDTLQAYAMFCVAAEGGYTNTVPYRDSVAQSLTPEQAANARQRVGLFKALMYH